MHLQRRVTDAIQVQKRFDDLAKAGKTPGSVVGHQYAGVGIFFKWCASPETLSGVPVVWLYMYSSSPSAASLLPALLLLHRHAAVWGSKCMLNKALVASCSAETGAMPIVAIELTNPATKETRVFSPVKDRPEVWEVCLTQIT